jgi:hypothetical protein
MEQAQTNPDISLLVMFLVMCPKGVMDLLVSLVLSVLQVLRVLQDTLVPLVLRVQRDLKVNKV